MTFNHIIEKLEQRLDLDKDDLNTIYELFENKSLSDEEIATLLFLWGEKLETPFEIWTLANLINSAQGQIQKYPEAIDICGTGGDKLNTFNISTVTAIVTSSLGIQTIKHSGRSSTSISGSVDILNKFNINLDTEVEKKEQCFKKHNLMFVSSIKLRDTFGDIKRISKKLNKPSFVNLLGPLTNPYKTSFHLLGVSNLKWGELLAKVLIKSEAKERFFIVCSEVSPNIYLDELSFSGTNHLWEKSGDGTVKRTELSPKELGIEQPNINNLKIKDQEENKLIFENILKGSFESKKVEDCINVVALNVGTAMYLLKKVNSIKEGYTLSLKHIQTGTCWEHFQEFVNSSK